MRRMIRQMAGIGVAFGCVVAAVSVAPHFLSIESVRQSAIEQIRDLTGAEPLIGGEISVAFVPRPVVTLSKVAFAGAGSGAPILTAERIVASLKLDALLGRRFQLSEITLDHPHIVVATDEQGRSNWDGALSGLSSRITSPRKAVGISDIRIRSGSIAVRDARNGFDERLENANLSLAWPGISAALTATGTFVWHDENVEGAVNLKDFSRFLSGANSGLRVRLAAPIGKLLFEGSAIAKSTLQLDGMLSLDGASMADLLRWAHLSPPLDSGFGRFALRGALNYLVGKLSLSNASVEIDGNLAEGTLILDVQRNRPVLSGTLAFDAFDARPYLPALALSGHKSHEWDRRPFNLARLAQIDADLRLSTNKILTENGEFGRTAASLALRAGKLAATVSESQSFGGWATSSVTLANADGLAHLRAQASFGEVQMDKCLATLLGLRALSGRGSLVIGMEAKGRSMHDLARTVSGRIAMAATNGQISDISLESWLGALARRPLSGMRELYGGRTRFSQMIANWRLADGVAFAEDVRLESPVVRAALTGQARLPARELDLKGLAALMTTEAGVPPFELKFVLNGLWHAPLLLPDPQSLIQRSGAAQSLVDVAREKTPREAVRSAIDAMAGAGNAPGTAPAPAAPAR